MAAEDGRHEVGEGFAGAGTGLGQQHPAALEQLGGGNRHVTLAVPRLERRQRADQRATLGERGADLCG